MAHNRGKHTYRTPDSGGAKTSSSGNNSRKGDRQKWYDDDWSSSDHNVKYLNKFKDMKEQLQKDGQGVMPSVGRGEHSRHKTHPISRPGLTRHLSLNMPVFVTSTDLSSVPRAGRLSMYSKANKPVPAIHPVQGVGLLDDYNSRKALKRAEQQSKRHNSLTPFDKVSPDMDRSNQPPTLKRFARSQKPTALTSRVQRASSDPKEEQCMQLRSYNVTASHPQPLGRIRSRSSSNEYIGGLPIQKSTHAFGRANTDKADTRGAIAKGKASSKYKPTRSKSIDKPRRVSLELAPVKRSITVDVPFATYGKGELDQYDTESTGYRAPVGTPYTTRSEYSDIARMHYHSSDSGVSLRRESTSTESSYNKRPDTSDSSDEWSDIGVTLSQIRLSHSQSEPSIKDRASFMDMSEVDADMRMGDTYTRSPSIVRTTSTSSSRDAEEMIPTLQINSQTEAENRRRMEGMVTINTPFIMFRPATPRMPEREEKTYDQEVGHVLVNAATQAETRRKEMRRLVQDIEEFNAANKNLYHKVNPLSG